MIININNCNCLSKNPIIAKSFCLRVQGMIGKDFRKEKFDAMVFLKCNCVHSFFMSIALDLIMLDENSKVVAIKKKFSPWSKPVFCRKACTTIELPVGIIDKTKTIIGNTIDINSTLLD